MVRLWRRFRTLSLAAQVATWIAVAGVYTVVLVVLLGGGSDDGGGRPDERVARDAVERRVMALVEGAGRENLEAGDVERFRRPYVRRVRCSQGGAFCDVVYSTALPGTGRILEDQQPILEGLFEKTDVTRVRFTVVRGAADESGLPRKADEETLSGTLLVRSECDEERLNAAPATKGPPGLHIQSAACTTSDFEGGRGQPRGVPGTDAGDQGPTGPPGDP